MREETGERGILDARKLPDQDFNDLWDAVIIEQPQKDRLLSHAVVNFTLRPKVRASSLPLHGLIVLLGPPGTGKTSLARGLASRTAEALRRVGTFQYLEVEPHSLTSAALGRSQQAVTRFLGSTVAERAANGPLIVLLDEVETLVADRAKISLEANPIDVHRATDAALAQLDHLAASHKNLLFIATSNFERAVDSAFLSRADCVEVISLPGPEACERILSDAVKALAEVHDPVIKILHEPAFRQAAKKCVGLDGRRIRKLVSSACARSKETALDPSRLTAKDILETVEQEKSRRKAGPESSL